MEHLDSVQEMLLSGGASIKEKSITALRDRSQLLQSELYLHVTAIGVYGLRMRFGLALRVLDFLNHLWDGEGI